MSFPEPLGLGRETTQSFVHFEPGRKFGLPDTTLDDDFPRTVPLEAFGAGLLLKAAPLKTQYPASDPPANTDHNTVFTHAPYFSRPEFVRSQNVSGHTTITYTPTITITASSPTSTAMTPAEKLSNTSMLQCWSVSPLTCGPFTRCLWTSGDMVLQTEISRLPIPGLPTWRIGLPLRRSKLLSTVHSGRSLKLRPKESGPPRTRKKISTKFRRRFSKSCCCDDEKN